MKYFLWLLAITELCLEKELACFQKTFNFCSRAILVAELNSLLPLGSLLTDWKISSLPNLVLSGCVERLYLNVRISCDSDYLKLISKTVLTAWDFFQEWFYSFPSWTENFLPIYCEHFHWLRDFVWHCHGHLLGHHPSSFTFIKH